MTLEEVSIQLSDLEDVRQALAACINYFRAADIKSAQVEFRASRPSPLTTELERVKERFDSYLGDYLLQRHEAALKEDDPEDEDYADEAESGSDELAEASEEVLSPSPLGEFKPPRQKGRRLSADEV